MKVCSFISGVWLALSAVAFAQQALTNDSIEKMGRARLGDDVITAMIENQPGHYDVTPDALIRLKAKGISNKVLAAMAAKGSGTTLSAPLPSAPSPPAPQPVTIPEPYEDLDVGVYHKVRNTWIPVGSEQVNWKTGGALKSIATYGIVKGDVNGRLTGGSSATQMNTPLQFLIRTADGIEATDFQLVHLHEKSDAREFRTVTGGVLHASGGSSRDAVSFEQTKIAKHTYKLTMPPNLPQGEYAFLAPGLTGSSASGSTGKAYTFRLVE